MAYKSSDRRGAKVRLIAVHTGEGARTAANMAAFFSRPDAQGSAHAIIDHTTTLLAVPYDRAAWTLRDGNPISDNVELCAFAEMTRAQWLSEGSVTWRHSELKRDVTVDRPRDMLRRLSAWLAQRCIARGIPIRKLTPAQVAAGEAGVIGHVDWTQGMRDGTHWDPGPGFPWDVVLADSRTLAQGGTTVSAPTTLDIWTHDIQVAPGTLGHQNTDQLDAHMYLSRTYRAALAVHAVQAAHGQAIAQILAAVTDDEVDSQEAWAKVEAAAADGAEKAAHEALDGVFERLQGYIDSTETRLLDLVQADNRDQARAVLAELRNALPAA